MFGGNAPLGLMKVSAIFCERYAMENICDSGITKFIEMVVSHSQCLNQPRELSPLQSDLCRNALELRRLASAVHCHGCSDPSPCDSKGGSLCSQRITTPVHG